MSTTIGECLGNTQSASLTFVQEKIFCKGVSMSPLNVFEPYPGVRVRNVDGFDFQIEYGNGTETGCFQKLGTGTERRKIFFKKLVRKRKWYGCVSKT